MMPAVQAESSALKVSLIGRVFCNWLLGCEGQSNRCHCLFLPSLPDLVDPVGLVVFSPLAH